jgi:uncharacterized protein Yka (UPF0111/DUF47 family)
LPGTSPISLVAARGHFIALFDRGDIKDLITSTDNAINRLRQTARIVARHLTHVEDAKEHEEQLLSLGAEGCGGGTRGMLRRRE